MKRGNQTHSENSRLEVSNIEQTFDDLIFAHAAGSPDKLALADCNHRLQAGLGPEYRFDYKSVVSVVSKLSDLFTRQGFKRGDLLAIQLPNTAEVPLIFLAAVQAGLIVTFLPSLWRSFELEAIFEKLPVRAIVSAGRVGSHNQAEMMCHLAVRHLSVRFIYGIGEDLPDGVIPLNDLFKLNGENDSELGSSKDLSRNVPENPVVISWSRDSEGILQPFYRTQQELIFSGATLVRSMGMTRELCALNPFPLTNIIGLVGMFVPWLLVGGTLFQHNPFDHSSFVTDLTENEISYTALPASVIDLLTRNSDFGREETTLKWLGAVQRIHQSNDLEDLSSLHCPVFDFHNLEEIALVVRPHKAVQNQPFIPLGSIRVHQDDDTSPVILETRLRGSVRSGEFQSSMLSGTLMLRGPIIPSDAFAALPKPLPADGSGDFDGWVHTAISASIALESMNAVKCSAHPDYIYHGGELIKASELDDLYSDFPDFIDAAAFAIQDPLIGDRIYAAIVPAPGISPSKSAFDEYLNAKSVAPFKIPEKLVIVSIIPRDDQGQVLRDQIIDKI